MTEDVRVTEACDRVVRWIEEGLALLPLLRALSEDHEQIRQRMKATEQDLERLEQELAALQRHNERFVQERAEAAEVLSRAIGILSGPLREVVKRLESSPPTGGGSSGDAPPPTPS